MSIMKSEHLNVTARANVEMQFKNIQHCKEKVRKRRDSKQTPCEDTNELVFIT